MNEINSKSQSFEEEKPSTSANLRSLLNSNKLVEECNKTEEQVHSMPRLESATSSKEMPINC